MALTLDTVKKVAKLAHLEVQPSMLEDSLGDLTNILLLIDKMQAVDTEKVEPLSHPLEAVALLRTDQVTEQDQRSRFQSVAPEVQDNLYLVPQVID